MDRCEKSAAGGVEGEEGKEGKQGRAAPGAGFGASPDGRRNAPHPFPWRPH